jgi:uncharacterized damage-inducible protein DinB
MSTQVDFCKKSAIDGMEMFLRNFSYVPDGKLNWSPTATSKTALQIAAHTAVTNANFAKMIRDKRVPGPDEEEAFIAQNNAAEAAITNSAEMESAFRANTQAVIDALDTLTAEDADIVLDSGQGWTMPMTFLMGLAGWHATLHLGQIDFLQTCWGDQQIYTG